MARLAALSRISPRTSATSLESILFPFGNSVDLLCSVAILMGVSVCCCGQTRVVSLISSCCGRKRWTRRIYQPPELVELGDAREVTLGAADDDTADMNTAKYY